MPQWKPIFKLQFWQSGTIDLVVVGNSKKFDFRLYFVKYVTTGIGDTISGRSVDSSYPNELPLPSLDSIIEPIAVHLSGGGFIPWVPFWSPEILEFSGFDYDPKFIALQLPINGGIIDLKYLFAYFEPNGTGGTLKPAPAQWGAGFSGTPLRLTDHNRYSANLPYRVFRLRIAGVAGPSISYAKDTFGTPYTIADASGHYKKTDWNGATFPAPVYQFGSKNEAQSQAKYAPEKLTAGFGDLPGDVFVAARFGEGMQKWTPLTYNGQGGKATLFTPYLAEAVIEALC